MYVSNHEPLVFYKEKVCAQLCFRPCRHAYIPLIFCLFFMVMLLISCLFVFKQDRNKMNFPIWRTPTTEHSVCAVQMLGYKLLSSSSMQGAYLRLCGQKLRASVRWKIIKWAWASLTYPVDANINRLKSKLQKENTVWSHHRQTASNNKFLELI